MLLYLWLLQFITMLSERIVELHKEFVAAHQTEPDFFLIGPEDWKTLQTELTVISEKLNGALVVPSPSIKKGQFCFAAR